MLVFFNHQIWIGTFLNLQRSLFALLLDYQWLRLAFVVRRLDFCMMILCDIMHGSPLIFENSWVEDILSVTLLQRSYTTFNPRRVRLTPVSLLITWFLNVSRSGDFVTLCLLSLDFGNPRSLPLHVLLKFNHTWSIHI